MTVIALRTINCDGRDCANWIYQSDQTADVLRAQARRVGWTRAKVYRDGRPTFTGDFCPTCGSRPTTTGGAA